MPHSGPILLVQLLQPIAATVLILRPFRAVPDHVADAILGPRLVKRNAVVRLHEVRALELALSAGRERGAGVDVAAGLLHDRAEDDASVQAGFGGDGVDGGVDGGDLRGLVVAGEDGGVERSEAGEGEPGGWIGEGGCWAAVQGWWKPGETDVGGG